MKPMYEAANYDHRVYIFVYADEIGNILNYVDKIR